MFTNYVDVFFYKKKDFIIVIFQAQESVTRRRKKNKVKFLPSEVFLIQILRRNCLILDTQVKIFVLTKIYISYVLRFVTTCFSPFNLSYRQQNSGRDQTSVPSLRKRSPWTSKKKTGFIYTDRKGNTKQTNENEPF